MNNNKANFQDLCESLYLEFKSLNPNTQKLVAPQVSTSSDNIINIIHSIFPKLKDIVSTLKDLIDLEGSVDGDRNPIQKLNHNSKYTSMETLINHFKHYSEGVKVPRGFVYKAVEAPKGEFGVSIVSDGTSMPYRCKIRTPAYHHMQVMPRLVQGHFFADLVTVLGSQDIVFGDVDR
jgi:NADH-quinone oxidoreductase subunit D